MTKPKLRVQFAHGLESSPQGSKARLLAQHFEANTPAMNTRDFESCVQVHADALVSFKPDVLIGSSFGGAVVVELLKRGLWKGPTLLLAQAALHYDPSASLPAGVPVMLVHARADDIVDVEHSRKIARQARPEDVELIEREDDHALTKLVESGELIELVETIAERAGRHAE